jgi:formate hydrogenlyase subunit 6
VNAVRLLLDNLREGPVTVRLPEQVPTRSGYRGLVTQKSGCIGCGICAYVCAPGAIEIHRALASYDWIYEPGKCTFCARCTLDCPVQVLTMSAAAPPPYSRPGELHTLATLPYPACRICGRPAPPASELLLDRVFGAPSEAIRNWSALCADCRRRERAAELLEASNVAP